MRVTLLVIAVITSLYGSAQQTITKNNAEHEIRTLMNNWMVAVKNRDEKTLNRIMAPEYVLDDPYSYDRPALGRDIWLTNAMKNLVVDSVHYYNMKVNVIDNVAVVQSKFYWSGTMFGKPFIDSNSVLVDTWIKRKEGWQVISRLRVDKQ